ncbi:guanine nucleotide-binding protein G(i) subunit alpha-1-like [Sycon ciliatum]|uniref:guanine nucleotide-binding protein G(i) subunit alpha-1-like n=1 Tax=Sycon ciliatum TaxID=27933 RepID=UPI0020AE746C|eukprot:scpid80574/ scgid11072/ Guanine nucleotide-binding protein G(i) subunit alpha-1; Adenylate cyclase-inhibiting G alpha protein
MGCSCSTSSGGRRCSHTPRALGGTKSTAQSLLTDKNAVHSAHKRHGKMMKVLITGTEQTGKTTVSKAMKIALSGGLTKEEMDPIRSQIHANLLQIMQTSVAYMEELKMSFADSSLTGRCKNLQEEVVGPTGHLDSTVFNLIEDLWKDSQVKECFEKVRTAHQFISDGAEYLLTNIQRYRAEKFDLTDSDILNVHLFHTDISELYFTFWKYEYAMYDFSSHSPLNEILFSKFNNVEFVVFCASLADYDVEDEESSDAVGSSTDEASSPSPRTTNRMHKSLELFDRFCQSSFIQNTFVWLILNKKDLFRHKLIHTPLTVCFPDYKGKRTDAPAACNYIKQKFRSLHPRRNDLFVYVMCATDVSGLPKFKKAFERASECRSLDDYGLLAS